MRTEYDGRDGPWVYYRVIFDKKDIPMPTSSDLQEWYATLPKLKPSGIWTLPGLRHLYEAMMKRTIRNHIFEMFRPREETLEQRAKSA